MRRRLIAKVVIALVVLATILTSVAPAFADDTPIPSDGSGLEVPEEEIANIFLPPAPKGRPVGDRLYVRTSAATPTEYLMIRAAIYTAGLSDVLEVAPGALIVATGKLSVADATSILTTIDGVTEIAPAPPYLSPEDAAIPLDLPAWWWYLGGSMLLAALAFALAIRNRPALQR